MAKADYSTGPTGEVPVEDAGFVSRWMWVYFSPRKAFTAAARRPSWAVPFILLIVLAALSSYITGPVGQEYMKQRIEQSESIGEDAKDRILSDMDEQQGPVRKILTIGGTGIFMGILHLALGGIFLFMNNLILGGTARFSQTFSAACYLGLIQIPSWIVKTPLMLAQKTVHVFIGPAALMPPEMEGSLVWALVSRLDLFGIWQVLLACIALSCLGGYSAKRASAAVIPLWVVYGIAMAVLTWFGLKQMG